MRSVPTIKYYLREGLLPEGEKRTPRLTDYDKQHVRRLELLRILRDAGDVPVEGLKRLVAATETPGTAAPLLSVTRPVTVARPVWAEEGRGAIARMRRLVKTNNRIERNMAGGSFLVAARRRDGVGRERPRWPNATPA